MTYETVKIFTIYCCFLIANLSLMNTQTNSNLSESGDIETIINKGGQTFKYSKASGLKILMVDKLAFKDMNKNGKLDKYEDWRLSFEVRAKDLAAQLSFEQIAGLMLYSANQSIPAGANRFFSSTYNRKPFKESGAKASDLSDQQKKFLSDDNLRHVLVTLFEGNEIAARWNNNVQSLVEGLGFRIPANNSSDQRHGTTARAEYNEGAGGQTSMWPGSLGMAATFDPNLVKQFGKIAAEEYRALGITTALSPQIDLATEPRWSRVSGTFGEDPLLDTDLARAYTDGFQTSTETYQIARGWCYKSVSAMVKHWPGGGSGEVGRDAHFGFGKYAVYPGNQFEVQKKPFLDGAFKLEGKTKMASAVMPYYTISQGIDTKNKENAGNAFSKYNITDLFREKYGYDGVLCIDWGVTKDHKGMDEFGSTPWGVETLSVAERHYKALMAGMDQSGGNNDAGPVIEACKMGVKEHKEKFMRERIEKSVYRLLLNIFHTGLFENPYLDVQQTVPTVGKPEFMKAGYNAQLKTIVMLKNKANILPLKKTMTLYIPKRYTPASRNFMGMEIPEKTEYPVNIELAKKYLNVTDDPAKADVAICFILSPNSGSGYSQDDIKAGGNGYVTISLQYNEYTVANARETSIAGGDPLEKFTNSSYKGKSVKTDNSTDLKMVLDTKKAMNGKPVIVSVALSKIMLFAEFEKEVHAIVTNFGVHDQAIFDILSGKSEPSALLPMQMPFDMITVEEQFEDVPRDLKCYIDSEGNSYDFAFGLNWKGVI